MSRESGRRAFFKEQSLVFGSIIRLKIHSAKRHRKERRKCVEMPFAGTEFDACKGATEGGQGAS